jgi:hypothetical protein
MRISQIQSKRHYDQILKRSYLYELALCQIPSSKSFALSPIGARFYPYLFKDNINLLDHMCASSLFNNSTFIPLVNNLLIGMVDTHLIPGGVRR